MSDSHPRPPRSPRPAAHLAAAIIAAAAAIALLSSWPRGRPDPGLDTWWPAVIAVVATAAAYAVITSILHFRLFQSVQVRASNVETWVDAAILLECGSILWRGAASRVLLADLPLTPPLLAVVAAASLLLLVIDRRAGSSAADASPKSRHTPLLDFSWRLLAAIALVAAVAWLESHALPE